MKWNYACPRCKATLNPGDNVILIAAHGETRVLVGLHPEPGNYEVFLPPNVKVEAGSRWDFFCPICNAGLVNEKDENLCELDLTQGDQSQKLVFSTIAGEQATFVIRDEEVSEKHGKDWDKFDYRLAALKYIRF